MALDLESLWDFGRPEESERRLREALADASDDDALILQTQIARTHGLRRAFDTAREVLRSVEPRLLEASGEARVRYHLELGRSHASATHASSDRTPSGDETARRSYLLAAELAEREGLDGLTIDALHMLAFVDSEPSDQLRWHERALAVLERSEQPAAKRWEASLLHNLGYARRLSGDLDGALLAFRRARAARERAGQTEALHVADWMIAWTLRAQGALQEALVIQQRLEKAWDELGRPDAHVFEELAHLYDALGRSEDAARYATKLAAVRSGPAPT